MASPNIFSAYLQPPKSVADYGLDMDKAEGNQLALAASRLQNQQAQQGMADDQSARQASIAAGGDTNKLLQLLQSSGNYKGAQALQKSMFDNQKTQSDIGLNTSKSGEQNALAAQHVQDTQIKAHDQHLQQLQGVSSPDEFMQWVRSGVGNGTLDLGKAAGLAQTLQQDPTQFDAIKQKMLANGVAIQEQFKQAQEMKRAQLSADTSTANTAANNRTSIQTTGMNNATSRANTAATIGKDYKVAGIDPQTGNFIGAGDGSQTGMAGMVDALGSYKLDPAQAFSRMAPAMKAGVIAAVQQKYPDYDPSTYATKVKAARDFGSGSQGNAMRSFAVAGQHLDQLGALVDAMGNGNVQIINKLGNAYATQTGNPAPTNFDAAKDVVGKEVVKAIVAGGGGVAERQELSNLMSQAKSPAQLKGVIAQYRNLMAAQHDALLQQRDAAGLSRKTLPAYTDPSGGGANADLHNQADAILRGGK